MAAPIAETWEDRLPETASYESPSGEFLLFTFNDVSQSFVKHTTGFDFPGSSGTLVQGRGKGGRRVPIQVYFEGATNDLEADVFMDMLGENGVGTLNHPRYGDIRVVPFGEVQRRDPLVTLTNQTIITVNFFETTELLFPNDSETQAAKVEAAIAALFAANPAAFGAVVSIDTVIEEKALFDDIKNRAGAIKSGLDKITSTVAAAQRRVDAVSSALVSAIDAGVGGPISAAFQVGTIITTPARTLALVSDKLEAYGSLLVSIFTGDTIRSPSSNDSRSSNRFRNDDMQTAMLLSGLVESAFVGGFKTQTDAVLAAEQLLQSFDDWSAWRDLNLESLGVIDTGEQYDAVKRVVINGVSFLLNESLSLLKERSIVTTRPENPITLEAFLYGTVDVNLDFLIETNGIEGDEIFQIAAGRVIRYYV